MIVSTTKYVSRQLYNQARSCYRRSALSHRFKIRMAQNHGIKEQKFDYFLVLDFEATCQKDTVIKPQEIIELPVLKVSGKTFEVEATFHQYVQPRVNNQLTPFCVELTGIVQDMVDGQPHIEETLQKYYTWMEDEGLVKDDVKFVYVTCGDWDLKKMLPSQADYFRIDYPDYMKHWINIKKPFCDVMGNYPKGMMGMLASLQLHHQGRHHSGIDDCKNIARILKALAERGYVFKATGSLQ